MSSSETSSDDDLIFLTAICDTYRTKRKRKRRYWVHSIFQARLEEGEFHTLFRRLQEDDRKFYKYYRMTPEKFNQLLGLLHIRLSKQHSKFRRSISPQERLTVFLR